MVHTLTSRNRHNHGHVGWVMVGIVKVTDWACGAEMTPLPIHTGQLHWDLKLVEAYRVFRFNVSMN